MPRQARQKSQSGNYHIVLRGINKQLLFEEEEDKEKFISCLQHYKGICEYEIYGYCLMDNHVHILLKEGKESIDQVMKKIGVSYVSWYNRKYDRSGHLFQDRFRSEVVETEEYLLVVLRYIHQNPIKSGEVKNLREFKWSSYGEYIDHSRIVDREFIFGIFANEREKAVACFKQFMKEQVEDNCIEANDRKRLTDQELKITIQEYVGIMRPIELQHMEKVKRDEFLRKIKKIAGISTRQIARLTGISQSVVVKA
jgi:putative transposase